MNCIVSAKNYLFIFLLSCIVGTRVEAVTFRTLVSRTEQTASAVDVHLESIDADLAQVFEDNLSAVDEVGSIVEKVSGDTSDILSRMPIIEGKLGVINSDVVEIGSNLDLVTSSEMDHIVAEMSAVGVLSSQLVGTMTTLAVLSDEIRSNFDEVDAAILALSQKFSSKSDVIIGQTTTINSKLDQCCSKIDSQLTDIATDLADGTTSILAAVEQAELSILSDVDRVASRVVIIAGNTSDMRTRVTDIDTKVDSINSFVPFINSKVDFIAPYANDMQSRIIDIDTKVDDMQTRVINIDTKIDTINSFMPIIESNVDRINPKANDMQTRITDIDTKVDDMQTRVVDIDTKVDDIQSRIDLCSACCPIPLTTGGTLTVTGGNYCLVSDVTGDITISATGVTLDLNDHTLTGGITINASADKATVRNGKVVYTGTSPAITINAAYCTLDICRVEASRNGITCSSTASFSTIKNCTVIGGTVLGSFACINLASGSSNVIVSRSILIGSNGTVSNTTGTYGISIAATIATIEDCLIQSGNGRAASSGGTGAPGITATGSSVEIRRCTITAGNGANGSSFTGGNGGQGITLQSPSQYVTIDSCDILATGSGGSGTTGGNGGIGIGISDSLNNHDIRISNCTISNTGAGGSANGNGGDGIAIGAQAFNIIIEGCSIESTGAGSGTGRAGYAINDLHTANDSMIYSNYAHSTHGYVFNRSSVDDVATYGTSFVAGTDRLSNIFKDNI